VLFIFSIDAIGTMESMDISLGPLEYNEAHHLYTSSLSTNPTFRIPFRTINNTFDGNIEVEPLKFDFGFIEEFDGLIKNLVHEKSSELFGKEISRDSIERLYHPVEFHKIFIGDSDISYRVESCGVTGAEYVCNNSEIICDVNMGAIRFEEDRFSVEFKISRVSILNYFCDYPHCMFP